MLLKNPVQNEHSFYFNHVQSLLVRDVKQVIWLIKSENRNKGHEKFHDST